jgi:hypothetical protein
MNTNKSGAIQGAYLLPTPVLAGSGSTGSPMSGRRNPRPRSTSQALSGHPKVLQSIAKAALAALKLLTERSG